MMFLKFSSISLGSPTARIPNRDKGLDLITNWIKQDHWNLINSPGPIPVTIMLIWRNIITSLSATNSDIFLHLMSSLR